MTDIRILNGIIEIDREPVARLLDNKLSRERDIEEDILGGAEELHEAYRRGYDDGHDKGGDEARGDVKRLVLHILAEDERISQEHYDELQKKILRL